MRYCDSNGEHCYSVYDVALASGYQAEEVEGLKNQLVWIEWSEGKSLPEGFHLIVDGTRPDHWVLAENPINGEQELVWDAEAPLYIETLVEEERDGVIVFKRSWEEDPVGYIEPPEDAWAPHLEAAREAAKEA